MYRIFWKYNGNEVGTNPPEQTVNNLKITAEGVPEEVRLAGDSTVANVTNQFPGVFKARFSPRQSKRADRSAEIRRFVWLAGCVVLSFFPVVRVLAGKIK